MDSKIIWLSGLSGSGKTTISKLLFKKLKKKKFKVKIVDGDDFRKKTRSKNNFSKKDILLNNYKIIEYVKKIENKFDYVLVSVISPLRKSRLKAKKVFRKKYYEILVKCSLKTLQKRDTKGLYLKAKKKIIKNLIGYNSKIKYQYSRYRVTKIETEKKSKNQCVRDILKII
tara:strand:- start:227 stop:739 length:513 start_codon:yes stop_codon:yes gene_type:complete